MLEEELLLEPFLDRFAAFGELYSPATRALVLDHRQPPSEAARASPLETRERLHRALAGHAAFVTPGAPSGVAPAGLETTGDPAAQLPWSHAGMPSLTLPAGSWRGLPHAIQLVAPHGDDEALLRLGALLERHAFPPLS